MTTSSTYASTVIKSRGGRVKLLGERELGCVSVKFVDDSAEEDAEDCSGEAFTLENALRDLQFGEAVRSAWYEK